jgi:hypothetical protein
VISAAKSSKVSLLPREVDPAPVSTARTNDTLSSKVSGDRSELRAETRTLLACARARFDSEVSRHLPFLIRSVRDWPYVINVADRHGVLPLLYESLRVSCADIVPAKEFENIQARCRANAQHNLHLTRALISLLNAFEAQSVSAVPYKGPILAATAYGNLSLRQFCDLDILVREHDVLTAMNVLRDQGFTLELPAGESTSVLKLIGSKKDFKFVSNDHRVVVELHWRLAGRHFYFPFSLDELWPRLKSISFSGKNVLRIPAEDLLIILCAHGSKHLWARLLWICDIAELIRSTPKLDWGLVMLNARKCGSLRMLLLGLHLAHTVLGTTLPEKVKRAIGADRSVDRLAGELIREFIENDSSAADELQHHSHSLYPVYIRMRERPRDKASLSLQYLRTMFFTALTPSSGDRDFVALPTSVSFLYYFLRPFRLIGRSARSHWGADRPE